MENAMRRRALVAALATVALGLGLTTAVRLVQAAAPPASLPAVYPVPQSMHAQGRAVPLGASAALVTGPGSDPAAVTAAQSALSAAGVRTIDRVSDPGRVRRNETAVYVGGPDENPATAAALRALGAPDAAGLAAEGYVLAAGEAKGRPTVVLDGHDTTGTFYAAQTMRQLIARQGGHADVPGVVVRDWPAQAQRGVIEGFYGTPWSDQQRLAQLDFYGAHKLNIYVYSPKDDPYLRAQWRDPYPPAQLAQITALVDRATANHVEFTYALSPGLSVCYSSATDEQALVAKFQSLWDAGVRTFSVPLDDISYTSGNCAADQTRFGTGGGAAGAAQAYLLNEVQRDFIATHPGASRLQMVPTEYSDVASTPYKTAIRNDLDPAVVVGWTGVGVIAPSITDDQAAAAKSVFGHDILLWDNYPVNDYVTNRLLLGPYVGREPGLSLSGITANPMIQPEASKVALFTVADYAWNDTAYRATASWQAGLDELAGPDPKARVALDAFADLEHYSDLDTVQAPALAARIAAFWPAWESGQNAAANTLGGYLDVIANLPATLKAHLGDPEFVTETTPWLDSAGTWGQAAGAALDMLVDERSGRGAAALADRARARSLAMQATSYTYVGLGGTVGVTVGDGVIDRFVTDALAENERWLGVAGRHATATTSMPAYQTNAPANMVDGDDGTYFWSSQPPVPGDYAGVDLGSVQPVSTVSVHMGKPGSTSDYIHGGVLESSADGSTWTPVGTYVNQPDIEATLPAGAQARYVRLRDTGNQSNWVVVREFTVTVPDAGSLTVSGTPAGADLAAAADGNVDTAYTAGSAPRDGDALVVTLPRARPLQRIGIVGTGAAAVQARVGGQWRPLGTLRPGGYTELDGRDALADAIRLAWVPGSAAPSIAEVVPWYAGATNLAVTPSSADVSTGERTKLTVTLTATGTGTVGGILRADPPAGVTASPARVRETVLRGSQQMIPLTLTASRPGTYTVPVRFTPEHGAAVTLNVTLVVHPAVSATDAALASQGATATASSVEQGLAQFTPDHAIDGDAATRWSSGYTDGEWLQVRFAAAQHLGKVVVSWETAHATAYNLEVSADGTTWTTAVAVTGSSGGTETFWLDEPDVAYLRVQGVSRATAFGYSIYELQAYPIAG
jgi:hyaluronoglucosaminidase